MLNSKYFALSVCILFLCESGCKKHSDHSPRGMIQDFYVNENSRNGSSVGIVIGIDPDATDVLHYSIVSGNSENAFRIEPLTGRILVNNSNALDFEKYNLFKLKILIRDDTVNFASDTTLVYIHLNNINISVNGLAAHFPFDENIIETGGVIEDSASNIGYNSDRFNVENKSVEFQGWYSFIKIKNVFDFPKRSISFWFRSDSLTSDSAFSWRHPSGYDKGIMYCSDNPNLRYGSTQISVTHKAKSFKLSFEVSGVSDSVIIRPQEWNHVALIVSSDTVKLYLNSLEVSKKFITSYCNLANGYHFTYLGSNCFARSQFYLGRIDDLYIYNKALTEEEVYTLFKE